MKKTLLIFTIVVAGISMAKAQTQDSCYVYAHLFWCHNTKMFKAMIQLRTWKFEDIKDEHGKTLPFGSFIQALNYLSVKGWNLVELYHTNAMSCIENKEMLALIRKKMSIYEAEKCIH